MNKNLKDRFLRHFIICLQFCDCLTYLNEIFSLPSRHFNHQVDRISKNSIVSYLKENSYKLITLYV